MSGLTLRELSRRNPVPRHVRDVLAQEQRRGHVEQAADGTWHASPDLVARFGRAFGEIPPTFTSTERRTP